MAVKKEKGLAHQKEETERKEDSVYSVREIAGNGEQIFGSHVREECVYGAFKLADKDCAAVEEAKKIVFDYLKREVL